MRIACAVLIFVAATLSASAEDDRFPSPAKSQPATAAKEKPAKPAASKSAKQAATKKEKSVRDKSSKDDDGANAANANSATPQEPPATMKERIGWRLIEDPVTHMRLGLPGKLVPQSADSKTGSRWMSARGEVQIETFRVAGAGTTLAGVFEQQKKNPANRRVEANKLNADSFVLTGLQGLKNFHVHAQFKNGEVRGLTILHDQAMEGIMAPVVTAMWGVFVPFPDYTTAGISNPYRRKVEYGTGIVVSDTGHIVTDRRLVDGCSVIVVAEHGNADRIAEDKAADLALIRLYGARNLKPIVLAPEGPKGAELTLVGIADPQAQAGGSAVTTASGRLGNGGANTIEPSPVLGFAGAAALDAQGRIVGVVSERTSVVAGPTPASSRAALVPAAMILKFLEEAKVVNAGGRDTIAAAKTGVVRVICVRK
ncbi:MAG: trypsin-like peptidase domain-containing protein [Rhizobiales bacterium]|nr:trypsin-like peptidase domain-containing protein [Hyphomicrobiales bacterium]